MKIDKPLSFNNCAGSVFFFFDFQVIKNKIITQVVYFVNLRFSQTLNLDIYKFDQLLNQLFLGSSRCKVHVFLPLKNTG